MARISGAICQVSPTWLKIFHQQMDRQAALHFELAVDAGLGARQHLGGHIGGDDLDAEAGELGAELAAGIIASE